MKKAMSFSILFLLVASIWGSPVFAGAYGADSAFFSLMGRLILDGKVMYRDYLDVKGPVFFFWEAFGQLFIKGRGGIFVIECICMLVTAAFLYKICRFYELNKKTIIFVHAVFYLIYLGALWGGNTCEEYCLPLLMVCLYLTLVFLRDGVLKWYQPFLFGISFACFVMSKATIAAPLGAMMVCVLVVLIKKKRSADIIKCVGIFFLGAALIAGPVFVYYRVNNALSDMIDWAYVKAFSRAVDFSYDTQGNEFNDVSLSKKLLYMCPIYAGLFTGIVSYVTGRHTEELTGSDTEKNKGLLLVLMSVFTLVTLCFGTSYIYYYIIEMPLVAVCASVLPSDLKDGGKDVLRWLRSRFIIVTFIISCVVFARYYLNNIPIYKYMVTTNVSQLLYQQVQDIYGVVPEDERDEILFLSPGAMFFEANGIVPETKYPNNMEYIMELEPKYYDELMEKLESDNKPKWIICANMEEISLSGVRKVVQEDYKLYAKGNLNQVYRLVR